MRYIVLASAISLFMMTFLCLLIYVRLSSMETTVAKRFRELEDRLASAPSAQKSVGADRL